MTVPETLAVVLNPASGWQKAEGTTSLRGTKQSRKEITGLQERQDLQVFI
jgi:hypothetical protein